MNCFRHTLIREYISIFFNYHILIPFDIIHKANNNLLTKELNPIIITREELTKAILISYHIW